MAVEKKQIVLCRTTNGWDLTIVEGPSDADPDAYDFRIYIGVQIVVWVRYVHPMCAPFIRGALDELTARWREGRETAPAGAGFV